ncbi:phosphotransferase family protein [Kutzneria kofuensis]|uniref:Aminoglycoside phosphotransferase (APT) family kinase protein n=1 Tax=Kutzneria kofuensis TaxID=103725 RepID=A0A7W9KS19_9PSEU|nr:phosphotransferase [Kutzneria kofuensis]MBB5897675.1 aminoglycoside phosphotransferase (APT) family kinase protein [Kutzneria kofuensis]
MWPESEVVSREGLREGGSPWLLTFADGRQAVLNDRGPFETEVAALQVAAEHGVPAPRVLDVSDKGLLLSVVHGISKIPQTPPPARLHALGAAAATIHAVELAPTRDLPVRHRPIEGEDFEAWRAREGASPLLLEAEQAVRERPAPPHPTVLLHGDLWQGNTMWHDGELSAVIDWDCAGVGHPGVDIGELRCEVNLMYGGEAADLVVAGWEEAAGRPAPDLAYWDVVASLSTPPDVSAWLAVAADQGRTDLDGPTLNARRDEFLKAALNRL